MEQTLPEHIHPIEKPKPIRTILRYTVLFSLLLTLLSVTAIVTLYLGYLYAKQYNPLLTVPNITQRFDTVSNTLFGPVPTPTPADTTLETKKYIIPKEEARRAPDLSTVASWHNDTPGVYPNSDTGITVLTVGWKSCPYCTQALAYLSQWRTRRENNINFISIQNPDSNGYEDIEKYLQYVGVDFPVGLDQERSITTQLDLKLMPYTAVIDSEGYIRFEIIGAQYVEFLRSVTLELLKEKSPISPYCLYRPSGIVSCKVYDTF